MFPLRALAVDVWSSVYSKRVNSKVVQKPELTLLFVAQIASHAAGADAAADAVRGAAAVLQARGAHRARQPQEEGRPRAAAPRQVNKLNAALFVAQVEPQITIFVTLKIRCDEYFMLMLNSRYLQRSCSHFIVTRAASV